MTPTDEYAFVGGPRLIRPKADVVHISCTFTWDIPKARWLQCAWGQYYPTVIGGPAFDDVGEDFTPGLYVRQGVIVTSRGCNNHCPWCLVPQREGPLREIPIHPGNNLIDNNLLQCSRQHIGKVIDMLRHQHAIIFSGGFDSRLLTDSIAEDLRSLSIRAMFFACDTKEAIRPLERARRKLDGFSISQLRCFVLLGFENETIDQALERLIAVWDLGFLPFAMLYQPPDGYIEYSQEWRKLAKNWTRPARTKAFMRGIYG